VAPPLHDPGDIFRRYGDAFLRAHQLGHTERKVFDAVTACRAARLGGHLDVCTRSRSDTRRRPA